MRLFIAASFDDAVKEYLKSIQTGVRKITSGGTFTREENFHLTLVFLGELAPEKTRQIEQAMNAVNAPAFELTLGGIGRFKRESGDIVWVGVKQNETLSVIYNQLYRSLKSIGFTLENRDYKPHLTLAREVTLIDGINSLRAPDIKTKISRISLTKSERIGGRLVYTEVHTRELRQ